MVSCEGDELVIQDPDMVVLLERLHQAKGAATTAETEA